MTQEDNTSIKNAGIDFFKGSCTFICIKTAPAINMLIPIEPQKLNSFIQIPKNNKIASDIFEKPTKYINHNGRP